MVNNFKHDSEFEMDVEYVGRVVPKPNPILTLDALDHPILAWAELESYRITGDKERLRMVFEPLKQYYLALQIPATRKWFGILPAMDVVE